MPQASMVHTQRSLAVAAVVALLPLLRRRLPPKLRLRQRLFLLVLLAAPEALEVLEVVDQPLS